MNALKLLRAKSGLSVRDLSAKAGVSAKTITMLENDRQRTTLRTLVRLADVLEADLNQLTDLLDTSAAERGRKGYAARQANKQSSSPGEPAA
jgi:transcriptional regulator with XRE-family HTH domain